MSKATGWIIGRWAGVSVSAALAAVGVVALRHALETPQTLKSVLPGEAHLYRWRRRSIFYKVLGSTEALPLVLLHRPDIGASGHEMVDIMSPLAETYRVYALDWLGFGLSDRPGMEYSAELYGALCQDFLREVVQQPAILVASGLSCNYAVAVATSAPDLCASLVLISPHALLRGKQPSPLAQLAEKPPVKALLYPLLSTRLAFQWMRLFRRAHKEDFTRFYENTHQLGAEHAAMALLAGKLTGNVEQEFAALQQPVLMIWGTRALDNQQTVTNLRKTTMLANPAHRVRKVEIIQEAARAVHIEQPGNVTAAIRRWQEETNQGKISTSEQTLLFTSQAAERQKARTVAAPRPEQTRGAGKQAHLSAEVPVATPAELDRTEIEKPALAQSAELSATVLTSRSSRLETEEVKPDTSANSERGEPEITAYCVKCKQKRTMLNARAVVMKNGRPAMRGVCPVCGTRLNRIGGIS